MAVNRRFLYVGVFLIAAGAVVLVAQAGGLAGDAAEAALRLWPLLVVTLGIALLMRLTRYAVVGGVLAALVAGMFLGGVLADPPRTGWDCGDVEQARLSRQQGSFTGPASVELDLACGEMSLITTTGSSWWAETGNSSGGEPTIRSTADGLTVASATRGRGFWAAQGGDVWKLALPVATRLDLDTTISAGRGTLSLPGATLGNVQLAVDAGDARIDLTGATVEHLSVRVNAAAATVQLPSGDDFEADLTANVGGISICAPSDLGLRIHRQGGLGPVAYAGSNGLGDTWESPGYAAATHHADVTVTANVGSVDVNPEGGCK